MSYIIQSVLINHMYTLQPNGYYYPPLGWGIKIAYCCRNELRLRCRVNRTSDYVPKYQSHFHIPKFQVMTVGNQMVELPKFCLCVNLIHFNLCIYIIE
jgi:hypothetical protein